jgi:hypothetical protein
VSAHTYYGVSLVAPVLPDSSWQAQLAVSLMRPILKLIGTFNRHCVLLTTAVLPGARGLSATAAKPSPLVLTSQAVSPVLTNSGVRALKSVGTLCRSGLKFSIWPCKRPVRLNQLNLSRSSATSDCSDGDEHCAVGQLVAGDTVCSNAMLSICSFNTHWIS